MDELSPLDGRYRRKTEVLRPFFSEEALMRARAEVEMRYFLALAAEPRIRDLPRLKAKQVNALMKIIERFSAKDAAAIRGFERKTNHDVKAVEYFLQSKLARIAGLKARTSFLHFALTSEDVNNLAYGILVHRAVKTVILPDLNVLHRTLAAMAKRLRNVPMLSFTHGQPATPTTPGKEIAVFADRLKRQIMQLKSFRMQGKFGGAVGNYAAHRIAYPDVQWEVFGRKFMRSLGLDPLTHTTQINPHDDLAELSHIMVRMNTILLDYSRDAWLYISRGVFAQKLVAGEVGSSTMPHKVNPIDFENAEGNLGLSTALFSHFAQKLPVSRLQRDLSDSTVQRNIGVAFGYHLLAVASLLKGIGKLTVDRGTLKHELDMHPEVLAEAIQILLRKHGVDSAYEQLKKVTRGAKVTRASLLEFAATLPLTKAELQQLKHWPVV
ncbi:adenylosuccinate lyase [Candidatus Peregrinibacteria bacterium CG1_02_54_53]|nr:MAG: adenylosuccinate lyase [Candidatus Peregrinibacteria bacterium CG1_02_54_53]